jgi:hypothetical protein
VTEDRKDEQAHQDAGQKQHDEAKKLHEDQIVEAYKGLAATGFSKEQAAQQLSQKYAMSADEVNSIIADVKIDEKNEKSSA